MSRQPAQPALCNIKSEHTHTFYDSHADVSHLQGSPNCRCEASSPIGPHKSWCPVAKRAKERLAELNERADELGIGYGSEIR